MPANDMLATLTAVVFSAAVAILIFKYHREIAEALEAFRSNWPRGGPGSPMHPSIARDTELLTRNRRKTAVR